MNSRSIALLALLSGCSLVYDPSKLSPKVDAMPDAEPVFDADPTMLAVEGVTPTMIVEGQGDGGSRPALVVIRGQHMVLDGLAVSVTATAGATDTPHFTIDPKIEIDANGRRLAFAITLPVDEDLDAGETIGLDVTVTQNVLGAPLSKTLVNAITIRGLDELDGAAPAAGFPPGVSEYSRVNITSGTVKATANTDPSIITNPVIIRATSTLTIDPAATITVAAAGRIGGPGAGSGGTGGAGSLLGGDDGAPGTGPAPGTASGAPGNFIGDSQLTALAAPNRGSGGAGGHGGELLAGAGGAGGGGGGSIELTAGGDLSIGNVNARGAAGANGANPGGGGSGGIILVRAGHNLTAGTLDVTGFPNAGRARFEAAGTATVQSTTAYTGPMFVEPPTIVTIERPELSVVGGPLTGFSYFIVNDDGTDVRGPFEDTIAQNGAKSVPLAGALFPGLNNVCLLVAGAAATSDTRNCIEIIHLYRP
jgi:hypothetical protein